MEEDRKVPLISGRPFLATGNTLIDVQQEKLTLRVKDEEVIFNVFEAMKYPSNHDECHYIDIIEKVITEVFENETPALPLEACLIHSATINKDDFEKRSVRTTWKKQHYCLSMGGNRLNSLEQELKELPQHLRYF